MLVKKYSLFLILITLTFSSCDSGRFKDVAAYKWEGIEERSLEGGYFEVDSLIMPNRIVLSTQNGLLLMINSSGSQLISLYDLESGKYIKSLLNKGNGPGELVHVEGVQFIGDGGVAVFGLLEKKVFMYRLASVLEEENPMPDEIIDFSENNVTLPRFISGGIIADTRFNFKPDKIGRLNFYNKKGQLLKVTGSYPDMGKDYNPVHLTETFHSFWDSNLDVGRIVLSHSFTDLIEVYDDEGTLLNRVQGPDNFLPVLLPKEVGGGVMHAPTKNTRRGYSFVHVGKVGILALYSGKPYSEAKSNKKTMIFFDLNGKPLAKFTLNIPIFYFDVDWEKRVIYGVTDEADHQGSEVAIVKYQF